MIKKKAAEGRHMRGDYEDTVANNMVDSSRVDSPDRIEDGAQFTHSPPILPPSRQAQF